MGRSSSRPNMAYSAGSLICIGSSASRDRRKAIIVHCGRMGKRHERVYGEEHQKKSSKGTVRTKIKCGNVKMQRTRDFSSTRASAESRAGAVCLYWTKN